MVGRSWSLWSLPRGALGYVLSVDLLALLAVAAATATNQPTTRHDWVVLAVLLTCAGLHLVFSRWIERARRDATGLPHLDLCSIWIFAGSLLLPPPLVGVLVVVLYAHRWWVVGRWDPFRPPHRGVFTAAMMLLVALAANVVATATGLRDSLASGHLEGPWDLLGLIGAGSVYWTVNTALVAGVIVLTTGARTNLFGGPLDNLLEAAQLSLAFFVAIAVAWWPGFAFPMVVAAVALHRTVLIHQLELAARTDAKTGLLNAEAWHLQARVELNRTRQRGDALGLLMIDVDHFKGINDTHGHQTGDEVLRSIADVIRESVRRGDSVGRFGGEEFVVLLPGAGRDESMAIAERARTRVGLLGTGAGPVRGLTVSVGVAVWPDVPEDTVEGLLAAADGALYQAKRLGRDQSRAAWSHQQPSVRSDQGG
ncbi:MULTISPECIES: GGDEF domain-containing protein [Actinosynnema]|uniref:GGDEF domain-containing protein n=1 Tax=Actinosynnema TaxID=40566 RepID=UPI0020A4C710|nr:GGDEF domain-containing protein [Actinosynnema pretiosum]